METFKDIRLNMTKLAKTPLRRPLSKGLILWVLLSPAAYPAPVVNFFDEPGGDFNISSISGLTILGMEYTATFHHGISFNAIPAGAPPITFTTAADATQAAMAIQGAIAALMVDASGAVTTQGLMNIPYRVTDGVSAKFLARTSFNPLSYGDILSAFIAPTAPRAPTDAWVTFTLGPVDSDGDGVNDDDDFCPNTIIPESIPTRSLGVNRFVLEDGDNTFDTTSPRGKGPGRSYTTTDTAGCSCTQIIEAQSLGKGHTKFGCSISAMDDWVEFVTP